MKKFKNRKANKIEERKNWATATEAIGEEDS